MSHSQISLTWEPWLSGSLQAWHLFDFSACQLETLFGVFLRGNFTGGKKESTPSIIEEGVCRELDRITKSNGILAWSQLYNHNHCQERQ